MTRKTLFVFLSLLFLFALGLVAATDAEKQDWTNYVRIAAYGLKGGDALQIVRNAQASNVFGIEVDNDIPGRYESFVNPEEKLGQSTTWRKRRTGQATTPSYTSRARNA